VKEENISLAILLAKKAGFGKKFMFSTSSIAEFTGYSQQSISRKLREMEADGIILRKPSTSGIEIMFTEKGRKELESLYLELSDLFLIKKKKELQGKVIDGLGEGKYYTQIPQYKSQFKELFGIDLYPGTLNLSVDSDERSAFLSTTPLRVNGFQDKDRTFGGIDCWQVKLNGSEYAVAIIPHRTNHPKNVIEVVSSFNLRKKLNLKNNSVVKMVMA